LHIGRNGLKVMIFLIFVRQVVNFTEHEL
jgi:hypothetical protein